MYKNYEKKNHTKCAFFVGLCRKLYLCFKIKLIKAHKSFQSSRKIIKQICYNEFNHDFIQS